MTAGGEGCDVKDLRCMLGMHKWRKRQVEDSQYLACARCGRERNTIPPGPTGTGIGGLT